MFVARLVTATIATIVLMAILFVVTAPAERTPGDPTFAPPIRRIPTPVLFRDHCAQCHGENGNGHGTTELERPARSFLAGGFAYGNTLMSVMRTITHGIPGTAMPAFGESLTDQQRSSLALHVIGFGPRSTTVRARAGVLAVESGPLVVQGMCPDPGPDGKLEPRTLMIGFPGGISFQYRQSDATLLAIRHGDFLERADWQGAGGAPLRPLGKIHWLAKTTDRWRTDFVDASSGAPLRRSVRRVSFGADWVQLELRLFEANGATVGFGAERITLVKGDGTQVATRTVYVMDSGGGAALRPVATDTREGDLKTCRAVNALLVATSVSRTDVLVYAHAERWNKQLVRSVSTLIKGVE